MNVAVNPPKTPITKGSNGIATATLPNICKMPGPPAPFVPAPLPNIGKSGDSPKAYSKGVKIEDNPVAIRGASFGSMGDAASKGSGGGMVSANTHGPCKFIGPGSMDVRIEGKNVQLLGDPVTNNGAEGGMPANSATMTGTLQNPAVASAAEKNPDNDDVCGAGKHTERIYHPKVPKDEWAPKQRLKVMRSLADTKGELFECAAAQRDIDDGDITHGSQLSRKLTDKERDIGCHEDDQKVMAVCTKCGYRRELDQAPDRRHSVEAKSSGDAIGAGVQKVNNRARLTAGNKVTYKSPLRGGQKLKKLLEDGFNHIGIE